MEVPRENVSCVWRKEKNKLKAEQVCEEASVQAMGGTKCVGVLSVSVCYVC